MMLAALLETSHAAGMCGTTPYDPATQFCCGVGVANRTDLGSQPRCCGDAAFSGITHMCCNRVILPVSTVNALAVRASIAFSTTHMTIEGSPGTLSPPHGMPLMAGAAAVLRTRAGAAHAPGRDSRQARVLRQLQHLRQGPGHLLLWKCDPGECRTALSEG